MTYGMLFRRSASSRERDWAFVRYMTATWERSAFDFRHSPTIEEATPAASWRSSSHSRTVINSPAGFAVQRSFDNWSTFFLMIWSAAARVVFVGPEFCSRRMILASG